MRGGRVRWSPILPPLRLAGIDAGQLDEPGRPLVPCPELGGQLVLGARHAVAREVVHGYGVVAEKRLVLPVEAKVQEHVVDRVASVVCHPGVYDEVSARVRATPEPLDAERALPDRAHLAGLDGRRARESDG